MKRDAAFRGAKWIGGPSQLIRPLGQPGADRGSAPVVARKSITRAGRTNECVRTGRRVEAPREYRRGVVKGDALIVNPSFDPIARCIRSIQGGYRESNRPQLQGALTAGPRGSRCGRDLRYSVIAQDLVDGVVDGLRWHV